MLPLAAARLERTWSPSSSARGTARSEGAGLSEPIRFFLPGPVYVLEEIRRAMTRPVVAHRAAEFRAVWDSISANLPPLFRTARPCLVATGS